MKGISIVMAYYNRRELLLNTLETINNSKYRFQHQVVIVDDASNERNRVDDLAYFKDLDVKIVVIPPEEKTWHNTCIPYNIGFSVAKYDRIIIQNAECMHIGDVIKYTLDNLRDNLYLSFSCYSVDKTILESINLLSLDSERYSEEISKLIQPTNDAHPKDDCENGWYNHSIYNPCAYHFCTALMKKDLDELGGFDERYADGLAYEDVEFLRRVRGKGMEVKIIDDPFVIHQAHTKTDYTGKKDLFNRNLHLFHTGEII